MKRLFITITETYSIDNDWRLDIVMHHDGLKEAYIYHNDYGVKEHVLGCYEPKERFLELVEADVKYYKVDYKKAYMN